MPSALCKRCQHEMYRGRCDRPLTTGRAVTTCRLSIPFSDSRHQTPRTARPESRVQPRCKVILNFLYRTHRVPAYLSAPQRACDSRRRYHALQAGLHEQLPALFRRIPISRPSPGHRPIAPDPLSAMPVHARSIDFHPADDHANLSTNPPKSEPIFIHLCNDLLGPQPMVQDPSSQRRCGRPAQRPLLALNTCEWDLSSC